MSDTRYWKFKLANESDSKYRGRITGGAGPASKKAFTQITREKKGKQTGGGKVKFSIRECTRGRNCKTMNYSGKRMKHDATEGHNSDSYDSDVMKFLKSIKYKSVVTSLK